MLSTVLPIWTDYQSNFMNNNVLSSLINLEQLFKYSLNVDQTLGNEARVFEVFVLDRNRRVEAW